MPDIDTPITREEKYLSKIAGDDTIIPTYPVTRVEIYLDRIARQGPGGNDKVPIYQGTEHSGEFLVVGSDGNVTTKTLAAWEGGSY